jgi:hypothetical protein
MWLRIAIVSSLLCSHLVLAQNETGVKMTVRRNNNVPVDVVIPGFSIDFGGVVPMLQTGATSGATLPAYCSSGQFFHRTTNNVVYVCNSAGVWIEIGTGGGGSGVWGGILGNLADQTDLQAALAAKEAALIFSGPLSRSVNAIACPTCIINSGSYADPSWIASIAASKLTGTVPAANGGAGSVNGILKANGSGTVSAAVAGADYVVPAGNVATATALSTARAINGVPFDGTSPITITANLPTDPPACPSGQFANDIGANGTLGCLPVSTTTACEVLVGDPGANTPVLDDDNDAPAICANASGSNMEITGIACRADIGTPTVRPIITGGAANSLLSSDLTCGTGSYAAGTLNGTPTLANGATIDANIVASGGIARYLVIRITRRIQ